MAENLLLMIIFLPLFGSLFVALSRDNNGTGISVNAAAVAVWTLLFNIALILVLFSQMNTESDNIQYVTTFKWLLPQTLSISFGVDVFALIMILGINLALLIGILSLRSHFKNQKFQIGFSLLFLCAYTGLFSALDLMSFYVFFVIMIPPLFMQIGMDADNRIPGRFLLYNFLGTFLLLFAVVMLYCSEPNNILIANISDIKLDGQSGIWVWSCIFMGFMFRIPVWPFHYWISSVNTVIRNPLTFICANMLPISGLFGFLRFWPAAIPEQISSLTPVFAIFCAATMLYLAFRGYSLNNARDKLFSYIFIYYLLYLLGILAPTDILQRNIAYSLFAFLLVFSGLSMVAFHLEKENNKSPGSLNGILCILPKASFAYSLLISVAIGFPVSALFWNNFIIVSQVLYTNVYIGVTAVLTLLLAAAFLLQHLYSLKNNECMLPTKDTLRDVDNVQFGMCLAVMSILFLSFIKPLWFVY